MLAVAEFLESELSIWYSALKEKSFAEGNEGRVSPHVIIPLDILFRRAVD